MRRYQDNPVFPSPVVEASGSGKLRGLRLLPAAPVIVIAHVAKGCLPSPPPGTFCNLDWPKGTSDSLPQCGAPCLALSKARPVCRAEGTKSWLFLKGIQAPCIIWLLLYSDSAKSGGELLSSDTFYFQGYLYTGYGPEVSVQNTVPDC